MGRRASIRSVSPLEIACLVGGLLLLLRYRWIMDDAFVYFRYIDNLLFLKVGLVYNQYEYVEGFSSPGWLLLLLPLRATGADYWHIVLGVGCVTFFFFWITLVRLDRQLSPPAPILNLPMLYLVASYGVLSYFTSGMETPLVQLVAVAYALFVMRPSSRPLQLALAVSPLIRAELLVPVSLCIAWSWLRRRSFPSFLTAATTASVGSWVLFRIYYYADLLPNTFYLKNEVDLEQGFYYLNETLSTYHFYTVALLCLAAVLWLARDSSVRSELRLAERGFMLLLAASVTAYVVKIGGDARHYRYLAFPLCLAACAAAGIPEHLLRRLGVRQWWMIIPAGVLAFGLFFLGYPPQLDSHPVTLREKHHMVHKVTDASFHRRHADLVSESRGEHVTPAKLIRYRRQHPDHIYTGTFVAAWCAKLYRRFDERAIHSLGLTDAVLARTTMPSNRPAHKLGLIKMAHQLVDVQSRLGWIGRGMYEEAVHRRRQMRVPRWMEKNLDSLKIIEQKIYNRHDLSENLRLAFTWPKKIVPWKGPR